MDKRCFFSIWTCEALLFVIEGVLFRFFWQSSHDVPKYLPKSSPSCEHLFVRSVLPSTGNLLLPTSTYTYKQMFGKLEKLHVALAVALWLLTTLMWYCCVIFSQIEIYRNTYYVMYYNFYWRRFFLSAFYIFTFYFLVVACFHSCNLFVVCFISRVSQIPVNGKVKSWG